MKSFLDFYDNAPGRDLGHVVQEARIRIQPLPGLAAVAAHFRTMEQQRIAALHQQADSEQWNGQVFKRIEEVE